MRRHFLLRLISALLIINLTVGCALIQPAPSNNQPDNDALVATAWMQLYLYLIQQTEGFTPPVASRALGYAGITLYEALVPGLPDYQSLVGQLNKLEALPQPEPNQTYYWQSAANSALAALAHELFSNATRDNQALIDGLEAQLAAQFATAADSATIQRSIDFGHTLAEAIYQWSLQDGGHKGQTQNFPLDYLPLQGDGLWQHPAALSKDSTPTLLGRQSPLCPGEW